MTHGASENAGQGQELIAGLDRPLPRPTLPAAYLLGLLLVTAAMVLLPLLYLAVIAASARAAYWWATYGFGLLFHGSIGSARIRIFLYAVPLLCFGSLPLFLIKPLFARRAAPPDDVPVQRGDQPLLFAFVERLAAMVGAPVPDRIVVDTQVNAGAGLELGLLKREGSALVMSIGLPLVSGLTLPQFASVLAHEFGHFGQGAGMRLSRVIRGVNAWFARVVYERDNWDEALEDGRQEGGWAGLAFGAAQLAVALGRGVLYSLMMAGHGISCFLSRQMEFDADQYGARVAGSSVFADTSLRVRVLAASADYVMGSLLGKDRLVDDIPALVATLADSASSRLMADIRMDVQRSGTKLFDTHPSDLERLRRARAGRFPGLLKSGEPASALFRDYPAICRRATLELYARSLGPHAPGAEALLPVAAFVAPPPPPGDPKRASFDFPRERPPCLSAHARVYPPTADALAATRDQWRKIAPAGATAVQRFERARTLWLAAAQAEALIGAGLEVRAQPSAPPVATPEGAERTKARAIAMQSEIEGVLRSAEEALGAKIGLELGALANGAARPDAVALGEEVRLLLAALPGFEAAQAEAAALRGPAAVFEFLLAKQKNLMGHAGLYQEIDRRLPDLRHSIDATRAALERISFPGWTWDVAPPYPDDAGSHARAATGLLDVLDAQHAKVLARLTEIADEGGLRQTVP